jgi:macrolide transport system ATP-binding/permease protein
MTDQSSWLLLLDTELAAVIGELSLLSPGNPAYVGLDATFQSLMKEKRELLLAN